MHWTYSLAAVVLISRLVQWTLYDITRVSDWCWYIFTVGWFVLFFLALWGLIRLRWRAFAICALVLITTFPPALNYGAEPISQFQGEVYRLYALYRIRAVPLEEFVSQCKLIDYVEDDGTRQQIGQCNQVGRGTFWHHFTLIYDPTGQFALPGYRRTTAWRLAVQGWTGSGSQGASFHPGAFVAGTNRGQHVVGSFYSLKVYVDDDYVED
jgi:hypothetical protein